MGGMGTAVTTDVGEVDAADSAKPGTVADTRVVVTVAVERGVDVI